MAFVKWKDQLFRGRWAPALGLVVLALCHAGLFALMLPRWLWQPAQVIQRPSPLEPPPQAANADAANALPAEQPEPPPAHVAANPAPPSTGAGSTFGKRGFTPALGSQVAGPMPMIPTYPESPPLPHDPSEPLPPSVELVMQQEVEREEQAEQQAAAQAAIQSMRTAAEGRADSAPTAP